jgi:predicted ATPase
MTYVTSVVANILSAPSPVTVEFESGVNFLSGENGTGKSRLLQFVKERSSEPAVVITNDGSVITRIAFYNPKRNAQKREIAGLLQEMRQQGKTHEAVISQLNQNYADQGYVEYPNFTDFFVGAVDNAIGRRMMKADKAVEYVRKEFESVIQKVLPHFTVSAKWDNTSNPPQPQLLLNKYAHQLSPTQVSVGENEILALVFSVFSSRDTYDLYLLDEPEVHLNWSLEKNLFDFFDWFAKKYNKQIIIATHSPVVFESKYSDRVHFLSWDGANVQSSRVPTETTIATLASRVAATIVKLDDAHDLTFFVEDTSHKLVVDAIARAKGKNVYIVEVGSRDKVLSLNRALQGHLSKSVFMVDGDNDSAGRVTSAPVLVLAKYCIENYLLDRSLLAKISLSPTVTTLGDVDSLILTGVIAYKNANFIKRYKPQIILAGKSPADFFDLIDTMDGSEFFSGIKLHESLGYKKLADFITAYIAAAKGARKLDMIFKEIVASMV